MTKGHSLLEETYRRRFDGLAAERKRVWKVLCKHFFQRYIAKEATVVDIGCGYGEFINNIHANHRIAIDLNPSARNYVNAQVSFKEVDAKTVSSVVHAADVVFSSNFLEHLLTKADVAEVLTSCRESLKPGGRLILMGPNIAHLNGRYWDFFDHHVALSDKSTVEILELLGFQIDEVYPRFLPYTMSEKIPPASFLIAIYLRIPLLWRVYGRQFLIVATKPKETGEHSSSI